MILTIILTVWITCAIIYVSREMARPFSSSRSSLVLLDIIFAPYFITCEIIYYWEECKELRNRYKNN